MTRMSSAGAVEELSMRRLGLLLALGVLAAIVGLAAPASAAGYDSGSESVFIEGVHRARAEAGVGAIRISADLAEIARRHSVEMASRGRLYHNANLGSEVSGWQAIAENVGDGPNAQWINDQFRQSSPHRSHMVDPRWVDMGIGVAWAGDQLYVTEVFRQPAGATAAPAPAPAPSRPAPKRAAPRAPVVRAPAPAPAPAPPATPTVSSLRVVSLTGVADTSSPVLVRAITPPVPASGAPVTDGRGVAVAFAVGLQLAVGLLAVRRHLAARVPAVV
jgi:hypothetical protein